MNDLVREATILLVAQPLNCLETSCCNLRRPRSPLDSLPDAEAHLLELLGSSHCAVGVPETPHRIVVGSLARLLRLREPLAQGRR